MTRFLLVLLGGALGSGARYLVSMGMASLTGVTFPWGTLIVNLSGSFLIGLVMALMPASELRLMLVTGVLGGFTTYSSFNEETLQLMRSGSPALALLNLGITIAGCLVAGMAGLAASRMFR